MCFLALPLPTLLVLISLAELVVVEEVEGSLDAEAERMNQDFGFERNWARPDEGEAERDAPGDEDELGARGSAGGASALGEGAPLRRFITNPARYIQQRLCEPATTMSTGGSSLCAPVMRQRKEGEDKQRRLFGQIRSKLHCGYF